MVSHTVGSYNGSNVGWSRDKITTIVVIVTFYIIYVVVTFI